MKASDLNVFNALKRDGKIILIYYLMEATRKIREHQVLPNWG